MENDKYKNYLHDLGLLIKEYSIEEKQNYDTLRSEYRAGVLFGLYKVLSLSIEQAEIFEIPLEDLCLDDIDIDDYLT